MVAVAAHAVDDDVGPAGEARVEGHRACRPAHGATQLGRVDDGVGAQLARQPALLGMLGRGDEAAGQRVGAERGDRAETERARSDDGDGVAGDAGGDGGVDRARGRLDHHRGLVAHPVGHAVELALVGDERGAPAATRCRCRSRSAGRAAGGRRRCARTDRWRPRHTLRTAGRCRGPRTPAPARRRRAVPSSRSPTTSWPGTNGNETMGSNQRDERPSTVARSEPQMPGQARPHPVPAGAGELRLLDLGEARGVLRLHARAAPGNATEAAPRTLGSDRGEQQPS